MLQLYYACIFVVTHYECTLQQYAGEVIATESNLLLTVIIATHSCTHTYTFTHSARSAHILMI